MTDPYTFNYPPGAIRGSGGYYLDGIWNWLPGGQDEVTDTPVQDKADWSGINTTDKILLFQELQNLISPQTHREAEARRHDYNKQFSANGQNVHLFVSADPYSCWLLQELNGIPSNQDGTPAVPTMPLPQGLRA